MPQKQSKLERSVERALKEAHDAADTLYVKCRELADREVSPTAAVVDSQV